MGKKRVYEIRDVKIVVVNSLNVGTVFVRYCNYKSTARANAVRFQFDPDDTDEMETQIDRAKQWCKDNAHVRLIEAPIVADTNKTKSE